MDKGEVLIEEVDVLKKIKKSKIRDNEVVKAVDEINRVGVKVLWNKEWRKKKQMLLKEGKVYIPKDEELQTEVIQLYHNTLTVGHKEQ